MPKLEDKLIALSKQQGHYGLLEVRDVTTMLELRDDKIKELEKLLVKLPNE